MRTVAIEDIMADTIVSFCENAAQLGCPMHKDVDMWFRELSREERYEVMGKLIDIKENLISQEFESNALNMWFRELSREERYEVIGKLIDIEENLISQEFESNALNDSCDCDGSCGDNCKCNHEIVESNEFKTDKIVEMHEIELDLEKDLIENIVDFARSKIVNDRDELINYGINYALKEIIKSKKGNPLCDYAMEVAPLYDYSIIMEDHSIWVGQAETPLEAALNASEETGKRPMYFMSNEEV